MKINIEFDLATEELEQLIKLLEQVKIYVPMGKSYHCPNKKQHPDYPKVTYYEDSEYKKC